jgi:glutamyl-tRNA reductase
VPALDDVLARALSAARRVRTHAPVQARRASLGTAVVRRIVPDAALLRPATRCLIVGTGDAAASVLRALRTSLPNLAVSVIGRTAERVIELASGRGAEPLPWSALRCAVAQADVVIFAVATPEPVVRAAELLPRPGDEASRRLWIDLGVPPCADVAGHTTGLLYVTLAQLADSAPMPESIVGGVQDVLQSELARLASDLERRRAARAIAQLRSTVRRIAAEEAARAADEVLDGRPVQRAELESLSLRVAERILHPTLRLLTRAALPPAESVPALRRQTTYDAAGVGDQRA